VVRVAVLVDGLAHAAERLGLGYLPVLNVPGKRRISAVSARARIGEFCSAMFLLTRNWSSRFGSLLK